MRGWSKGAAPGSLALAAAGWAVLGSCGREAPASRAPRATTAPEARAGPPTFAPALATSGILVHAGTRGPLPPRRTIDFSSDAKCAEMHREPVLQETVVAKDGNLANVLVWVSKGGERWAFPECREKAELLMTGCMFVPHVLSVRTGQPVAVSNLDSTMHCVHVLASKNPESNRSLLKGQPPLLLSFRLEELPIRIKCDCLNWMGCWAAVFSHPFHAVTDHEGLAAIRVPPGDYEVSVWHEYDKFAKPVPQTVSLAAGQTKEVEFVFEVER